MLGGDWIGVQLPGRLHALTPRLRFVALGGATEASIHSTIYEVPEVLPDWPSIPYGWPMANQRTYILADNGQPAPVGVPGELHLAGIGPARGYLHRTELTAQKFVTRPDLTGSTERLYRTGDLAATTPTGSSSYSAGWTSR
jgi:non-ribosomal peptide synthetase component F